MRGLVTGSDGYVWGCRAPRLLARRHEVRVAVRAPRRIGGRPWDGQVEVVAGNLLDAASVQRAVEVVDAAYYLVHSMGANEDFAALDRKAATTFAAAAAKVAHVIYLGGLLPTVPHVSAHLRSRAEVGAILHTFCRTTEFRAGPVID